jgi:glycosyltransferase involved in cell wall biosynthesis
MRIGIDGRSLMDKRYSGVPEFAYNLVSTLLENDRKNTYGIFLNSFKKTALPLNQELHKRYYPYRYKIPNKILNYFLFNILNIPKIDKLLKTDIFFMPHLNFIALDNYKKCILTIHDLSFIRYPNYFSFRKNIWHHMLNVRKLVSRIGKIVAVSENTKNDLMELYNISPDLIKVIYPGISKEFKILETGKRWTEDIRKKYGLPESFILCLCTIEPRKNIEAVIRSYEIFRDEHKDYSHIKLVIAGGWGWKSSQAYQAWNFSEFKKDIYFTGYIDKCDKVNIYNLAELFVFPSFYEGFGFPPLESMACGTPVITGNYSSLPEIASNSAILIDPKNIQSLYESMAIFIIDHRVRNEYIKRGLETVKNFSWEITSENYMQLFNEING